MGVIVTSLVPVYTFDLSHLRKNPLLPLLPFTVFTSYLYNYVITKRSYTLEVKINIIVENDGSLDKESTSYNDIFDAFRL